MPCHRKQQQIWPQIERKQRSLDLQDNSSYVKTHDWCIECTPATIAPDCPDLVMRLEEAVSQKP